MPFIKLSLIALFTTLSGTAWASAEAAPAAEEGGEKKQEGAAPVMPKDQKEFVEKTSKLTSLGNRIEEADRRFADLVKAKAAANTTEQKQLVIKDMVEVSAQRNKDVEAYNKLKTDLSYRYPHQGEALNRRYRTQSKRSIEEMEGAMGLDELLTRTRKQVQKKFAPFMPEEEKVESEAKVASPVEEKPKRLRLEK